MSETLPQIPQPSLQDTTKITCQCSNATFHEVFILRRLSKLLSGKPKDTIVTIPVLACTKCGEIVAETVPAGLPAD